MYVNAAPSEHPNARDIRYFFFRHRDHIPGVLGVIALIVLIFFHPDLAEGLVWLQWTLAGLSIALIVMGEGMRIWSVGYSGTTTRSKKLKAKALATDGPYAVTRNPIYVGNFLLGLGYVLIPRVGWLVVAYVIAFAIQYSLIVSIEEDFLEMTFGQDYVDYKRRVRRFFPRLSGFVHALRPEARAAFSWKALRGEKWTLLNMLVTGTVLIGLNYWLRSRG